MATSSLGTNVTGLLEGDPGVLADPYELYAELRERAPVYTHDAYTLVSRYEDVRALFMDTGRVTKRYFATGSFADAVRARVPPELTEIYDEVDQFEALFISRNDDEQHARLRRIAHRAFTPRMIGRLDGFIRQSTNDLLDEAQESDEVDLIDAFAYRLPLLAIAQMLGVPVADADLIHRWSYTMGTFEGRTNMSALRPWHDALTEFRAYVHDLVLAFRDAPPDTNLVTTLLDARGGEQLSEEELLAMFVVLLFAGHETTTNLIGNGMISLLRHRAQWELLCREPLLAESAVEEVLRYEPPVQYSLRLPVVDVDIGDTRVHAADTLMILMASANRDPRAFAEPDTFDITRTGNRHLSLLIGVHFCLGASLARLEGKVALTELACRYPGIELAEDDLDWKLNPMFRSLRHLPVSLGLA